MTSTLLPFQAATRDVALDRLRDRTGARRFLIADEVGLGKTVVTRELLRELIEEKAKAKQPLNVFYIANNLNVAAQNRDSLAKADSNPPSNSPASRKADRLSLLATQKPLNIR